MAINVTGPVGPAVSEPTPRGNVAQALLQGLPTSPAALDVLREAGVQVAASNDCRTGAFNPGPNYHCVPGTNHLGVTGHFWTLKR